MGQYTSRIASIRRERQTTSNATSTASTPVSTNTSNSTLNNDHLSLLRRRRSSNNITGPPSRRRRIPERIHDILTRNDNFLLIEDESAEAASVQDTIQNNQQVNDVSGNEHRFMNELDSIATDLFNAVSPDTLNNAHHLPSLSSIHSTGSSASLNGHPHGIRSYRDDGYGVSLESQITMLSRLLEVACTSTLYTLLGRSDSVGRRFDNTSRNEDNDSTFQEFLNSLRTGLLERELGTDEEDNGESMTFFRAFRFDTLAEENSQETLVPVMIVGVRSVQQPINNTENNTNASSIIAGPHATSRGDLQSIHSSASIVSSVLNAEDSSRTLDEHQVEPHQRSWVIFVMGNTYTGNHPLLSAPSLLSENPSYEDLMNLQELLGQEKPPVAKKEDLKGDLLSEIKISDSFNLKTEFTPKMILKGERCQICLSDYEDGEVARKLGNCSHFYHKDCIETWLLNGKNNCPLCRSKGVGSSNQVAT